MKEKISARILAAVLAIMVGVTFTMTTGAYDVMAADQTASSKDTKITVKAYNATATSLSIQWSKEDGVRKYNVYRSTKKNKGYKKIGTTTKLKFTSKKLSEKRTYYYKVTAKASDGTKFTSNIVQKVKVKGKYNRKSPFGVKMSAKQQKQVKNAAAKFVNTKINPSWPAWKKALVAYNYVQSICTYASWSPGNGPSTADTAWGALVDHEAWCSGYAMAYKTLCDAMGIKCSVKQKKKSASHVWNVVKIKGNSYKVDTQGGYEAISTRVKAAKKEIAKGSIENAQAVKKGRAVLLTWDKSAYKDMTYRIYRLKKVKNKYYDSQWVGQESVYTPVKATSKNKFKDTKPKYVKLYQGYAYRIEAYKDGLLTDETYVSVEK